MTETRTGPAFPVDEIPFSTYGSWFCFSRVVAQHVRAQDLHLISHQTGLHPVLRLAPVDAATRAGLDATVLATPGVLSWDHPAGRIDLAYQSPDTVRLRGTGTAALRIESAAPQLTPFGGTYLYRDPVDGAYVFTSYETGRRYRVTLLRGRVDEVAGVQALGDADRRLVLAGEAGDAEGWEAAIEELDNGRPPFTATSGFDAVAAAARRSFAAFVDEVAPWRSRDTPAAELAAYVLWSATVRPAGFLARPGVLMSKHWMDKVWSWDHCFNALALAGGQPRLARDQFSLPFDHQDESGALPDSVTHSEVLYNFVKPPIHGWALHKLRRRLPERLSHEELAEIHDQLARWTGFWLEHRRAPGSRLPHYQHGNDSGWDNATVFDPARVVVTADLAAFLVLQLHELADLAGELGRHEQAAAWRAAAAETQSAMIEELWSSEGFRARAADAADAADAAVDTWTGRSLLHLVPIVLGEHLPEEISAVLARRIADHLTPHGLATEAPDSAHYQDDGYWRGPIWAPSTVLIEDGLRRAGHVDLADEIGARFRALCETSGFAENFDARTGAGLRDRAYTWTAAAYLLLAEAHTGRARDPGGTLPR
ncbi:trehalase family glycosidase [Kitasatospora sp. NPDC049285]|uniref:amylo-alpha-1,6-glucosidase n=1 Tax=Kitasatospora sp. NPDC049285 TaxID=3157096 RepID=UPI003447A96E